MAMQRALIFPAVNETHVYNPRWPPHARFHNGQTMTLGVLLATMSIYFAFRPAFTPRMKPAEQVQSVLWASTVGSFYCLAALCAIWYPGTDWKDPESEFGGEQKYLFGGVVVAMWVAYALEASRLGSVRSS
jgi:hypothetical protein